MKVFVAIILCFLSVSLLGQDTITVTLFDLKTNRPIKIQTDEKPLVSLVSNDEQGKRKIKFYRVNSSGQFEITRDALDTIGNNFTFSVDDFYETNRFSYANFEVRNISQDSAKIVLSQVYLTPSYWTNSCGADCFLIDNRRTFKKEKFIVSTPFLRYWVKRVPQKINQGLLNVKYVTDLREDIVIE